MSTPARHIPAAARGFRRNPWAALALLALAMAVRLAWVTITNWREDQAATLWLGATQGSLARPIGLLSSTTFPNANGMTFIASVLALAPGLGWSSALLAVIQVVLLGWLCFEVCHARPRVALLAALTLTCEPAVTYLGIEFWNQYTVGLLDVAFIASAARFCRAPSWRYLPLWSFLALAAPGLYLAGLANAVVYALIAGVLVVTRLRALRTQPFIPHLGLAAAVCALVCGFVWMPFVRSVDLANLARLSFHSQSESLQLGWAALWTTPACAVFLVKGALLSVPPCAGDFPWRGATWLRSAWPTVAGMLLVFGIVSGLLHAALARIRRAPGGAPPSGRPPGPATGIALCAGFAWLSLVLSPLLGGPALAEGARPDHVVRLLPLLIVAAVAAVASRPDADLGPFRRPVRLVGTVLLGVYILLGVATGGVLVTRHLTYSGPELTASDVTLRDKLRAVRFIAHDWRATGHAGNPSVCYQLMGGKWTFIPAWGAMMRQWYPGDVYTVGRGFDYELWHAHGLRNAQDGRERTAQGARYIVTYRHEQAPEPARLMVRHTIVGRLRVTIVEPPRDRPADQADG